MFDEDYYSFLGVSRDASSDEIKHAYRKKLIKVHPDSSEQTDDTAVKKLLMIYEILSDPNQKRSYDEGRAYQNYRKERHQHSKDNGKETYEKAEDTPEDFSSALYVNGIQAKDSYGVIDYIKLDDYIYYQVSPKKKLLFYEYTGKDYYRVKVYKIYSRKRNNFRKVPLFLVRFDEIEQVIFEDDFKKYWLSQKGFEARERHQAIVAFVVEISIVVFIIYLILQIK